MVSATGSSIGGISADGRVITGNEDAGGDVTHAYRYDSGSDTQIDLGTLGGDSSEGAAISADGNVIAGGSQNDSGKWRAFRWTQEDGMVDLGTLGGGSSEGTGLSADGSVVVGSAENGSGEWRAFRWSKTWGMHDLGTLGGQSSHASDVSADGNVVVGSSALSGGGRLSHAFRWTQESGMVDLGTLGGSDSEASAVSDDGSVVVGTSTTGADNGQEQRAFRWTQGGGMQTVEDWLRANGVSVSSSVVTSEATALSGDGHVVGGLLEDGRGFFARVDSDGNGGGGNGGGGNGLITVDELSQSLADTTRGLGSALSSAGLQVEGAHSRPLLRQVDPGRKTYWLAGDWGGDDHGSHDGKVGLAEIGVGRNFGRVQVNASLGLTHSHQSLSQGGKANTDGRYLMLETLMPVRAGVVATVGAFYHRGEANLKRAYLNAGTVDASFAKPDTRTWGLRARLDWVDLLDWNNVHLTPYADLLHSRARMDAYTETGGGFPSRFDTRKERSTQLRLGIDGQRGLDNGLTLLSDLAVTHRFQGRGAASRGDVIGLSTFNLPGERIRRTWMRGGVGVQGKLAQGTGSLMLNATTHGSMPTWWLAANWQRNF